MISSVASRARASTISHLRHFRSGEITLLLEPDPSHANPGAPLGPGSLAGLRARLTNEMGKDPIKPDTSVFQGPPGSNPRSLLAMGSRPRGRALQTITLNEWILPMRPADVRNFSAHQAAITRVFQVVAIINRLAQQFPPGTSVHGSFAPAGWSILSASPNWYVGALDGSPGGGGPSGPPRAAAAGKSFPAPETEAFLDEVLGGKREETLPVRIAVMDTWPTAELARIKATGQHKNNPRLLEFANYLIGPSTPYPTPIDFFDFNGSWTGVKLAQMDQSGYLLQPYEPLEIKDHGLHIAHIVNEIAPRARLSVYRVLDDYGMADLNILADAVEHALDRSKQLGERLVINMSLGFGPSPILLNMVLGHADMVPTPRKSLGAWSRQVRNALDRQRPTAAPSAQVALQAKQSDPCRQEEFAALMHQVMGPAREIFNLVGLPDAIAVASAGNDSVRSAPGNPDPAGPRFPAIIEGVLGVSSVKGPRTGPVTFSDFSNDDDLIVPEDDGVSAFGEDIVGLFSVDNFSDGTDNVNGWASWSGTSFAAPIVSAVAARMLAAGASPAQVQATLAPRSHIPIQQQ